VIDQNKVQEIIDKSDIVEIVSEYVPLTKRGKNFFGLCPFHDDTKATNFSVSPEKKIFKCYACGVGGSAIEFLKQIKNISFSEACVELAGKVGVSVDTYYQKKENPHEKYYKMNELASSFYEHYLFNSKSGVIALEYLHNRGLSDETIKKFKIGLAPKDSDSVYRMLSDKEYSLIDMKDIGLVKENDSKVYDFFSNRITFPITDEKGNILGFSGRIYYQSDTETRYANTSETVIYKKGETLFNLYNAIPNIRKMGYVILVEGQMDVIALVNKGITPTVCSLGTSLTFEQVKLIGKYTKNVMILYDGDEAGQKATYKAFKLFNGFNAKALTLPDDMDPDEFIKAYGAEKLVPMFKSDSLDQIEFMYRFAFKDKNLNIGYEYEATKNEVFDILKTIESKSMIETLLRRLGNDLKVSFEAINNDYSIYLKSNEGRYKPNENVIVEEETKKVIMPLPHERMYLALSISKKAYFDYYKRELGDIGDYTNSTIVTDLYFAISYYYENFEENTSKLMKYCYQETGNDYVTDLFDELTKVDSISHDMVYKIMDDSIKKFKEIRYRNIMHEFVVKSTIASKEDLDILKQKLDLARETLNNK